jgi:hypothetical protein
MSHESVIDARFAMVPLAAIADNRLSKMQLRVLAVICSFRDRDDDTVRVRRSKIIERCGGSYKAEVISRVTTQLVKLGWIEKVGNGGFSRPSEYRILIPETVTESVTVEETTVTESVTVDSQTTVTEPVTVDDKTVTESVTKRLPNRSLYGDRIGHGQRTDLLQTSSRRWHPPPGVIDALKALWGQNFKIPDHWIPMFMVKAKKKPEAIWDEYFIEWARAQHKIDARHLDSPNTQNRPQAIRRKFESPTHEDSPEQRLAHARRMLCEFRATENQTLIAHWSDQVLKFQNQVQRQGEAS